MVPTRQRGNHKGVTIGVQTFRFGTQLWSPNLQIWHTVMESKPSRFGTQLWSPNLQIWHTVISSRPNLKVWKIKLSSFSFPRAGAHRYT